jgi:hypothetical protein
MLTESDLSSPFYTSLMRGLKFMTHLSKLSLTSQNLVSATPFQLSNNVTFLVLGRVQTVSSRPESPNPIHFTFLPLGLFELLHFNVYDCENYQEASRRKPAPEKNRNANYNASKWTKQAIKLASSWEKANKAFSDPNLCAASSFAGGAHKKFNTAGPRTFTASPRLLEDANESVGMLPLISRRQSTLADDEKRRSKAAGEDNRDSVL